jgi:hypothetical protein
VHTLSLPNSGKHMDEGLEHLAQKKNVQTLTITSESMADYNKKMGAGLKRGEGDLAFT